MGKFAVIVPEGSETFAGILALLSRSGGENVHKCPLFQNDKCPSGREAGTTIDELMF